MTEEPDVSLPAPCLYSEPAQYALSDFSSFVVQWRGVSFPTLEHAYQFMKFVPEGYPDKDLPTLKMASDIRTVIRNAPSAYEARRLGEFCKSDQRPDWETVKVSIMEQLKRAKLQQHLFMRTTLLKTGNRTLVEYSPDGTVCGVSQNEVGQNMGGNLWMKIRADLLALGGHGDGSDITSGNYVC